jgi:hypothetical protein
MPPVSDPRRRRGQAPSEVWSSTCDRPTLAFGFYAGSNRERPDGVRREASSSHTADRPLRSRRSRRIRRPHHTAAWRCSSDGAAEPLHRCTQGHPRRSPRRSKNHKEHPATRRDILAARSRRGGRSLGCELRSAGLTRLSEARRTRSRCSTILVEGALPDHLDPRQPLIALVAHVEARCGGDDDRTLRHGEESHPRDQITRSRQCRKLGRHALILPVRGARERAAGRRSRSGRTRRFWTIRPPGQFDMPARVARPETAVLVSTSPSACATVELARSDETSAGVVMMRFNAAQKPADSHSETGEGDPKWRGSAI